MCGQDLKGGLGNKNKEFDVKTYSVDLFRKKIRETAVCSSGACRRRESSLHRRAPIQGNLEYTCNRSTVYHRHWMEITVVTSETNTTLCPASRWSPWACDIATNGISHLNFIENFLQMWESCWRIINLDAVQRRGVCWGVVNLGAGAPSAEGRHYWVTRVIWWCPLEILRYLNDESYSMIEKRPSTQSEWHWHLPGLAVTQGGSRTCVT